MRRTNNARRGLGIRGQLMFFLCFICLFLLVLFWILSTQLLEPLYTRHIERQLTTQAENVVSQLDDALAEGTTLSSWSFGRLYVNTGFFDKLAMDLYSKGALSSFCVDISDSTLRQIYKIENQSYCNLHETYLSDASSNEVVNTAIAMRKKCRTSPGGFKQTLNPPRLSGSAQLLVGRTTADGSYTVLVTTSLVHVAEASNVLSTLLPLAAALIFVFAMSAAWLFSEWFTKPLRQLSRAARQMAKGNYAVQVESRRSDELGDLAQDFNHMAEEGQLAAVPPHEPGAVRPGTLQGDVLFFADQFFPVNARPDADLGRAVVGDGQHRLGNGCKVPAAVLCHRDAKHSFVSSCV